MRLRLAKKIYSGKSSLSNNPLKCMKAVQRLLKAGVIKYQKPSIVWEDAGITIMYYGHEINI